MRIQIVVEVDDEITDPGRPSGLTAQAYEQLTNAIASTVGDVISVTRNGERRERGRLGVNEGICSGGSTATLADQRTTRAEQCNDSISR